MRVGHMDKITGQTPFYTSIKSHSIAPRAKFAKPNFSLKHKGLLSENGVKHGGFHQNLKNIPEIRYPSRLKFHPQFRNIIFSFIK